MVFRLGSGRFIPRSFSRWLPTYTFHDPNPPLTLEDAPASSDPFKSDDAAGNRRQHLLSTTASETVSVSLALLAGGTPAPDPFKSDDAAKPRQRSVRDRRRDTTAPNVLTLGIPVLVPRQPMFQKRRGLSRPHSEDVSANLLLTAAPAADPFLFSDQPRPKRQAALSRSNDTQAFALVNEPVADPFKASEEQRVRRPGVRPHSEDAQSFALANEPVAAPFVVQEGGRRQQVPLRPHSEIVVGLALTAAPAADPFRPDDAAGERRHVRLRAARSDLLFNAQLFPPGPVIPVDPVSDAVGGWERRGREPRPREAWPKWITLSDGRVLTADNPDQYARILGQYIAAEDEDAAAAIAAEEALQQELLERIDELEAETGRLMMEAAVAEAVALYRRMLMADDEAMILIMAHM